MTEVARWDRGDAPVVWATHAIDGLGFNSHQIWAFRRAEVSVLAESPFRLANGARASMMHVRVLPSEEYGAGRLYTLLDALVRGLTSQMNGRAAPRHLAVMLALSERYGEHMRHERFGRERDQLAEATNRLFRSAGFDATVEVHAYGHATAAYSVLRASTRLAQGENDAVAVIGLDTYYDPEVVDHLVAGDRLFDGSNDGFIPGEGVAGVLLARPDVARDAGWPALARIEAASVGLEEDHSYVAPVCRGDGLSQTVRAVTEPLEAERRTVDWWLGDTSTETARVRELQLALPRFTSGVATDHGAFEMLPQHFGDLGAATLPTGMVLAAEGFGRGVPRASNCLLFASSDGPTRGTILMTNPHGDRRDAR